MWRFIGILLCVGSVLLVTQTGCDQVRGETAHRKARVSPPEIISRATNAEGFNQVMALHWFVAVMPGVAGCLLLTMARREESLDMFSPDFKGLHLVEEAEEPQLSHHRNTPPSAPSSSPVPMNIPLGRILSVLICAGYIIAALASRQVPIIQMAVNYALLAGCLMLIWFPDEIGGASEYVVGNHGRVDRPTPGLLISCAGWFFLAGLPLLWFFFSATISSR